MTAALNSGPINAVSFPGSEAGSSLVRLNGQVVVTCEVSTVRINLTAKAEQEASAVVANVGFKFRSQVGASTIAGALSSANALSKLQLELDRERASAISPPAGALFKIVGEASASPSAQSSVVALVRAGRSASGVARAIASAASLRRVPVSASAAATAAASAIHALRKTPASGYGQAIVASEASIAIAYQTWASTIASAPGAASASRKLPVTATSTASALGLASGAYQRLLFPVTQSAAVISSAGSAVRVPRSASATVGAFASAGINLALGVGADTVAGVTSTSVAADFAVAIPAPEERRMFVPASERRMEVAP